MKTSDVVWMLNSFDLKLNTILRHIEEKKDERAKDGIYELKKAIFRIMGREDDTEKLERELIAKL